MTTVTFAITWRGLLEIAPELTSYEADCRSIATRPVGTGIPFGLAIATLYAGISGGSVPSMTWTSARPMIKQ